MVSSPVLAALVVDDDPINLEILSEMLCLRNWVADTAHSGCTAVVYALNKQYDLIFMDLNMPTLDGRSAMLEIRRSEEKHNVIVAVSAGSSKSEASGLVQAGFDKVLVKPFTCQEVFKICEVEELHNLGPHIQ